MRTSSRRIVPALAVVGTLAAACGSSDTNSGESAPVTSRAASSTASVVSEPTYESLRIPAPSLDGNLLGDPSEINVSIELPGSYASEPDRRYPVVYFLAGYDEPAAAAAVGVPLAALVESGAAPEMIVVGVSGDNTLGGSFYVDSPVSGRWATAVVSDLVTSIDATYRTLATPAARGIAGFSMGVTARSRWRWRTPTCSARCTRSVRACSHPVGLHSRRCSTTHP